jgi:hypothetical protein
VCHKGNMQARVGECAPRGNWARVQELLGDDFRKRRAKGMCTSWSDVACMSHTKSLRLLKTWPKRWYASIPCYVYADHGINELVRLNEQSQTCRDCFKVSHHYYYIIQYCSNAPPVSYSDLLLLLVGCCIGSEGLQRGIERMGRGRGRKAGQSGGNMRGGQYYRPVKYKWESSWIE